MSHGARIRLLQALVKPSLLYGAETWKLTPALLAKIHRSRKSILEVVYETHEQNRYNGRRRKRHSGMGAMAGGVGKKIAKTTHKQQIERWHVTALRLHWKWAGKAARNKGSLNHTAATIHIKPIGRGRPQAHWAQLLRQFSTWGTGGGTQFMGATRGKQGTMAFVLQPFR